MDHLPDGYDGGGGEIQQHGAVHSLSSLARRQIQILAIPTTYNGLNSGPPPGTVVGIVLGSVAGFLLIIWLIYTCTLLGGNTFTFPWGRRGDTIIEEEVIRRRSRSPRRSRSESESIEVASTHRTPSRRSAYRRETIVVEERRTNRPPGPGKLASRNVPADRNIGGDRPRPPRPPRVG